MTDTSSNSATMIIIYCFGDPFATSSEDSHVNAEAACEDALLDISTSNNKANRNNHFWVTLTNYYLRFTSRSNLAVVFDRTETLDQHYESVQSFSDRVFLLPAVGSISVDDPRQLFAFLLNRPHRFGFAHSSSAQNNTEDLFIINSNHFLDIASIITCPRPTKACIGFDSESSYYYAADRLASSVSVPFPQKVSTSQKSLIKDRYVHCLLDVPLFWNLDVDWSNLRELAFFQKNGQQNQIIKLVYPGLSFILNQDEIEQVTRVNDGQKQTILSNDQDQRFIIYGDYPYKSLSPTSQSFTTSLEFQVPLIYEKRSKNILNILIIGLPDLPQITSVENSVVIINKINLSKICSACNSISDDQEHDLLARDFCDIIRMNLPTEITILVAALGILHRYGGIVMVSGSSHKMVVRNRSSNAGKMIVLPDWMFLHCLWFCYENALYNSLSLQVMGGNDNDGQITKIIRFIAGLLTESKQISFSSIVEFIMSMSVNDILLLPPTFVYGTKSVFFTDWMITRSSAANARF